MLDFLKNMEPTQMLLIGVAVFLVATGRINLAALISTLLNKPAPGPSVPPPSPLPNAPPAITNVLKILMDLLTKAQASGDKEGEKAILATMKRCCDCENPLPHAH